MNHPATRNTLYVEQAELLSQDAYAEGQFHICLRAPETSTHAKPGHFIHMQCDPSLYMPGMVLKKPFAFLKPYK